MLHNKLCHVEGDHKLNSVNTLLLAAGGGWEEARRGGGWGGL